MLQCGSLLIHDARHLVTHSVEIHVLQFWESVLKKILMFSSPPFFYVLSSSFHFSVFFLLFSGKLTQFSFSRFLTNPIPFLLLFFQFLKISFCSLKFLGFLFYYTGIWYFWLISCVSYMQYLLLTL